MLCNLDADGVGGLMVVFIGLQIGNLHRRLEMAVSLSWQLSHLLMSNNS